MKRDNSLFLGIVAVAAFLLLSSTPLSSQQGATVGIDKFDR